MKFIVVLDNREPNRDWDHIEEIAETSKFKTDTAEWIEVKSNLWSRTDGHVYDIRELDHYDLAEASTDIFKRKFGEFFTYAEEIKDE